MLSCFHSSFHIDRLARWIRKINGTFRFREMGEMESWKDLVKRQTSFHGREAGNAHGSRGCVRFGSRNLFSASSYPQLYDGASRSNSNLISIPIYVLLLVEKKHGVLIVVLRPFERTIISQTRRLLHIIFPTMFRFFE